MQNNEDFNDHPFFLFKHHQKLLQMTDAEYEKFKPILQILPLDLKEDDLKELSSIDFGKRVKEKYFMLSKDCTFIQHGSFGATLKPAMKSLRAYQDLLELQPCSFMLTKLFPLLVYTLRELAHFIGADPDEIVFVPNATAGANTVLKSLDFKTGDEVVALSLGYDAVNNTIDHVCKRTGATPVITNIPFPLVKSQIVEKLKEAINSSTKLVVVDHITSGTGIILPIKEIIDYCKSKNVPIFIDGAHAIGQVPLDLNNLDPDFYTSNCHKWLCAPKGVAFLRVKRSYHDKIFPQSISHGYKKGFSAEFLWPATLDYSCYLSMITVLEFYNRVGLERCMKYNHDLVIWAAEMLAKEWGTEMLVTDPSMIGSMAEVRFPYPDNKPKPTPLIVKKIHDELVQKHNIQTVLIPINGNIYSRLSAQIYNDKSDYMHFAQAVKQIFKEIEL